MAEIQRSGTGTWTGDLKRGRGTASTGSGVLTNAPITFASRFESGEGSNPDELIAAAHASCFSMALSLGLSQQGHPPESIRTNATVTLRSAGGGFKIVKVHLETEGNVPGIDAAAFKATAEQAKENCPVSVLLKPGLEALTLDARLVS